MKPLALIACTALIAGPALAAPVALKPEPVDSDGVVTLGDLFDGTGEASATVVAPGPQAGSAVVLDAARVQAAARSAGLQWANPTGMRRIAVRAGAAPAAVGAIRSAGMVEALVYARSLNTGDVVRPEDLTWAAVASHLVPSDAPRDAESAMGQAARKPLRAGAAVGARDLAAARVIAKDETVSVAYRAGGLNLVLQGKALSAASVGDTVRVLNPASKKIVEAIAVAPGRAVVGPDAAAARAPFPLAAR